MAPEVQGLILGPIYFYIGTQLATFNHNLSVSVSLDDLSKYIIVGKILDVDLLVWGHRTADPPPAFRGPIRLLFVLFVCLFFNTLG